MSTYYCSANSALYDFQGDEDSECGECGCYYNSYDGQFGCDCCGDDDEYY